MRNPLVSIITITYNSEKYLEDTLRSVVGQDYSNIEYIIIDGGSTDNTLNIIEKYRDRIAKVICRPPRGGPDAMNAGIEASSGEIIGLIHSDDYYADSTVVSRVVKAFEDKKDIKVIYGRQDYLDRDTGEVMFEWGKDVPPSEIKKRMYMPHPTVFCRREVYEKIGLFKKDYKVASDYEWAVRVIKYTRPHFLDYKIACMRDMGGSGVLYKIAFNESVRALWENKYYFASVAAFMRNLIKSVLIRLGLKGLLYKLWAKNVSPKQ